MKIITISDYESDYCSSTEVCPRLNPFVMPEYIAHWFLTLLFLLCGSWVAAFLNLPLSVYHFHRFRRDKHLYEATEVYRVAKEDNSNSVKLGFYLLSFFYYLYRYLFINKKNDFGSFAASINYFGARVSTFGFSETKTVSSILIPKFLNSLYFCWFGM